MEAFGVEILPRESWRSVDTVVEGANLSFSTQPWKQSLGWDVIRKLSRLCLGENKKHYQVISMDKQGSVCHLQLTQIDTSYWLVLQQNNHVCLKRGKSSYTLLCNAASFTQDYSFSQVVLLYVWVSPTWFWSFPFIAEMHTGFVRAIFP